MGSRWAMALVVVGLTLFHAANNWIWLGKNVMTRGWDRIGALVNSLYYHDTLSPLSLQALFRASVQDEYRPPLFGMSMAFMYKLFGVSADVAVMVNILYLGLVLAAVYGIGVRLANRRLGVLGAVLVALLPLIFAMSRYSYFEFALAAATTASLYLVLASERFERKWASLGLGVSLGLGALVKRTFVVFILGAVLVVVFQARLPQRIVSRLRRARRPRWRDLGLSAAAGLLVSALWYLPSRATAQSLPGGDWLFAVWWALVTASVFFALQPSSPETNAMTSGLVALSVASVWYLPRGIEFVRQILWLAWGIEDPRGRTVDLTSIATYTDYLQSILYGLSLFYAALLGLSLGLVLYARLRRGGRLQPARWLQSGWLPIVVALGLAYTILSTSIYKEHRAITPMLPLLGVILAGVLLRIPWRGLRSGLIVLGITFGFVQFFAITYTGGQALVNRTSFALPWLGRSGLFAQGPYLETPDSGLNDSGFYIAADVLDWIEDTRVREGRETASLGVVAGSAHVHAGMFIYDQLVHYPAIRVENPVQAFPTDSAYSTAFRYDFVLVLSRGSRGAALREATSQILNERRSSFETAFELRQVFSLPDGSEALLFQKRYDSSPAYDAADFFPVGAYLREVAGPGELIIVPRGLVNGLMASYWGPARVLPVATMDQIQASVASIGASPQRAYVLVDGDLPPEMGAGYGSPTGRSPFGELQLYLFEARNPLESRGRTG